VWAERVRSRPAGPGLARVAYAPASVPVGVYVRVVTGTRVRVCVYGTCQGLDVGALRRHVSGGQTLASFPGGTEIKKVRWVLGWLGG
jgi:hypothetical protein